MNTQQFIEELAADFGTGNRAPRAGMGGARLAGRAGLASLLSLAVLVLFFSRSPNIADGPTATVIFTILSGAALAAGAFWATLKASYPESRPGLWWIAVPLAILAMGLGLELSRTPSALWGERLLGQTAFGCFLCVTLLSLPILAAVLAVLRHGATTHPRRSGAVAGLLAGGITAALYTLHCPEDSLLFVAAWHVLAIATVSVCGALVGSRYLRW